MTKQEILDYLGYISESTTGLPYKRSGECRQPDPLGATVKLGWLMGRLMADIAQEKERGIGSSDD